MRFKLLFTAMLIWCSGQSVLAQCTMCKANAESSLKQGSSAAAGLNAGIEYILVVPYLIAGVIGAIFYINYRKKFKNV